MKKRFVNLAPQSMDMDDSLYRLGPATWDSSAPEFLQSALHELRTPLQVIQGTAELMTEPADSWAASVETIRREAAEMSAIFEDVGYRRDIEAERLVFNLRRVDVTFLLSELAASLELYYPERLVARYPDALPPVLADARHLRVMLWFLLHNAARLSGKRRRDGVALTIQPSGRHLAMEVRDNGECIPANQHKQVFESATALLRHPRFGLGRGLYVVRQLARLMGGDVCVKAPRAKKLVRTAIKGNVFALTLPLAGDEL